MGKPNSGLPAEELRAHIDPHLLTFDTTAALEGGEDRVVGQERAIDAIKFGMGMKESGYNIFKAHRGRDFSNAAYEVGYHRDLIGYRATYVETPLAQARILDLGCGQTATQTALFHADGAKVTGIDVEIATYAMGLRTFVRTLRRHGRERAFKSLARHVLFDRRFFH